VSWDTDMNPWEIYQIQTELNNFNNTPFWLWGVDDDLKGKK